MKFKDTIQQLKGILLFFFLVMKPRIPQSFYRKPIHVFCFVGLLAVLFNSPIFGTFCIQVGASLKPFAIVVLNGEITVYSFDSRNGFEW